MARRTKGGGTKKGMRGDRVHDRRYVRGERAKELQQAISLDG